MQQALIKSSNKIIESEELVFIVEENMPEFLCPDENCSAPMIPAAYKRDRKQRPHFRTLINNQHSNECMFYAYKRLLKKGKRRKLTQEEIDGLPIPTTLELKKDNKQDLIIKSNGASLEEVKDYSSRWTVADVNSEMKNVSFYGRVSSISSIVDFYINCFYNRAIPLTILNNTEEYRFWFKSLNKAFEEKGVDMYGYRLFYVPIHLDTSKNIDNDKILRIKTTCGDWENSQQINPVYVSIQKDKITPHKVSRIRNEITEVVKEQKEAYKSTLEKNVKAYIFFLGKLTDSSDQYNYEVIEGHLVSRYISHPYYKQKIS